MTMAWMPAKAYGGAFTSGRPLGVVVHCTEGPLTDGMAESLMGKSWFGGPAGTSIHKTTDSNSIVEGVRRTTVAYHVGAAGNARYLGYEFCGKVAMSKADWRSPAALSMLRIAAPYIADDLRYCNAAPRWMSLTQIAAGERGLLTHNDVRLALGGTTHSDPGPNFPYSELLAYVTAAYGGQPLEDELSAQFESNMTLWTRDLTAWTRQADKNFTSIGDICRSLVAKSDAQDAKIAELEGLVSQVSSGAAPADLAAIAAGLAVESTVQSTIQPTGQGQPPGTQPKAGQT